MLTWYNKIIYFQGLVMKSKILVTLQFLSIFLMLIMIEQSSKVFGLGIVIFIISIIIGLSGIKEHKKDFNIRPDIKEDCILINTGIYKYIRHPMYFSVVFGMLGVLIAFFSIKELIVYIFLFIVMIIKLNYEESLWVCHTKEYISYQKQTKRFIPFVY